MIRTSVFLLGVATMIAVWMPKLADRVHTFHQLKHFWSSLARLGVARNDLQSTKKQIKLTPVNEREQAYQLNRDVFCYVEQMFNRGRIFAFWCVGPCRSCRHHPFGPCCS